MGGRLDEERGLSLSSVTNQVYPGIVGCIEDGTRLGRILVSFGVQVNTLRTWVGQSG